MQFPGAEGAGRACRPRNGVGWARPTSARPRRDERAHTAKLMRSVFAHPSCSVVCTYDVCILDPPPPCQEEINQRSLPPYGPILGNLSSVQIVI